VRGPWLSGCEGGDFIVYCDIVAEVLGRVVQVDLDSPRGPDASHRIKVPRDWIVEGSVIELELPRHLTCRNCEGGGCDVCERSGAVTLRGRGEPPDLVEVTLPARPENDSFVIRIPEHGGLASMESGLPRGQLFLRIEASEGSDPSASVNKIVPVVVAARRALHRSEAPKRDLAWLFPAGIAVAVFLGIMVWYFVLSR
jgi:hypothetical protein